MSSEKLEKNLRSEITNYLDWRLNAVRTEMSRLQSQVNEAFSDILERTSKKEAATSEETMAATISEHLRTATEQARAQGHATGHAEGHAAGHAEGHAQGHTAGAAEMAASIKPDNSVALLQAAVAEIDNQRSQSAILNALVGQAANFAPRVCLFVVRHGHAQGWKARGLDSAGGDETARQVALSLSDEHPIAVACRDCTAWSGAPGTNAHDYLLVNKFGGEPPQLMAALPLVIRNKAVAVLYADSGAGDAEAVKLQALETLLRVTGMSVELLAVTRGAPRPLPETPPAPAPKAMSVAPAPAAPEPEIAAAPPPAVEATAPAAVETVAKEEPAPAPQAFAEPQPEPAPEPESVVPEEATPVYEAPQTEPSKTTAPEMPVVVAQTAVVAEEPPAPAQEFVAPPAPDFAPVPAPAQEFAAPPTPDFAPVPPPASIAASFDIPPPSAFVAPPEDSSPPAPEPSFSYNVPEPSADFALPPVFETTYPASPVEAPPVVVAEKFTPPPSLWAPPAPPPAPRRVAIEPPAPPTPVEMMPPSPLPMPAPPPVETPTISTTTSFAYTSPLGSARTYGSQIDLPIEVADDERRLHNDARRFARLLVSEIKLYNEPKVREGRSAGDIYVRLREAIDRSRQMYDKRVAPPVASRFDYFHYELVNTLAEGDAHKLGPDYPGASA